MRSIRIFSILAAAAPLLVFAQVKEEWVARYDRPPGTGNDYPCGVVIDDEGNIYVSGYSGADYGTVKYNFQGLEEWVAIYNGPQGCDDGACAIALDNSGNVCVTGYCNDLTGHSNYATVKYNPQGEEEWEARYNGPGNGNDMAVAITTDILNNIYVTGRSDDSISHADYATIKYDSQGHEQWIARYNGPGYSTDWARAVKVDALGNVYVTGYSWDSTSLLDYATIKYNKQGFQQWVARYNGPGNGDDLAYAIAIDNAGNVYVTGYSWDSNSGYDYATIKYSPQGRERWIARYNGPENGNDQTGAIALDKAGNIYVTGGSAVFGDDDFDYATVKYSSQGYQLWATRYRGPSNGDDKASAIALDEAGNIYITGTSGHSYATLKYNTEGVEQWVERYSVPDTWNFACDLVISKQGNVYITGRSSMPMDYCTIKYNQGTGVVESPSPQSGFSLDITGSTIVYSLPASALASLKLFDASGRMVKSICVRGQGEVKVEALSPGVYFARLEGEGGGVTRKVVVVR